MLNENSGREHCRHTPLRDIDHEWVVSVAPTRSLESQLIQGIQIAPGQTLKFRDSWILTLPGVDAVGFGHVGIRCRGCLHPVDDTGVKIRGARCRVRRSSPSPWSKCTWNCRLD